MNIIKLPIAHKEDQKAVLIQYFQSDTLYILRTDGSVISTDNLNDEYSITTGEDLTKEFNELFEELDLVKMTQEEYDAYEEKVQLFLNKTQAMNRLLPRNVPTSTIFPNEDLKHFLKKLNDEEVLLVIKHADCL